MHPTIKFTVESSKMSINFLDVTVSLIEEVVETALYVKPMDSHQHLQSSSCHLFHYKKGIPYSQDLRLNCMCSETNSFDNCCNVIFWKGFSWKENTVLIWCERKYLW